MDRVNIVIFPNQLFKEHPSIERYGADGKIYLVEDGRYFTDFRFHKKKLILHRASMKYYEDYLRGRGLQVEYVEYKRDWRELIGDGRISIVRPFDTKLEKSLPEGAELLDSPAFMGGELGRKKRYLMGNYYRSERKRLGILMEGGKPMGGKWSFDSENRKRLPKGHICPEVERRENSYIEEARSYVENNFPHNPGEAEDFFYPVSHGDSERWLDRFIEERLKFFGDYEDAIGREEDTLYHSLLSPILNIGLLTPDIVIEGVLNAEGIPLNSKEGFIRQVIGWREFMLQIYLLEGERERAGNFFGNNKKIPKSLYEGTTGIPPVDNVIKKAVKNAYTHHIERLMIMGNYMLLMEYHPDEVYRWFMEMYIDAYDWVMVPNVYGMSQYADGGLFATKPYISSSNYILKMSDFPQGEWCKVWNDLYWGFLEKHQERLRRVPRMGLVLRHLENRKKGRG